MKNLLLLAVFLFLAQAAQSQKTTPLNRHFYEISKKDIDQKVYTMTESKLASKEMLYLVFDNQNRRIKQIKVSYNEAEKFNQELTDTYDSAGNLISQTLLNLDNQKSLTLYFDKGIKKGQVTKHAPERFEIWREGRGEPYELAYDDFSPSLTMEELNGIFAKNLTYPMNARRARITGTVYLALLISENGELLQYEVANSYSIDKSLAEEAVRVIQKYKGPYKPALDANGQPTKTWLYLPVRFSLG